MEAVNMLLQAVVEYLETDIERMLNMPYLGNLPGQPYLGNLPRQPDLRNDLYMEIIQKFKLYINNHFLHARPENAEILDQFADNMEVMLYFLYLETNPLHGKIMLSWITALSSEFAQDYWTRLQNFVMEEREEHPGDVFPPKEEVFTWMKYCPLDKIKVVIIGQDPYPNPGQAHGLSFSVKTQRTTSSLNKIFEELERDPDIEGFDIPDHGDLTYWAKQGVLLLNAVLTIRPIETRPHEKTNFHKNRGWEEFTNRVVSLISERNSGVVFLLWGEDAKRKRPFINKRLVLRTARHPNADPTEEDYIEFPKIEPRHKVLTARHPTAPPDRTGNGDIEFFGCGHFSETNDWLALRNPPKINWQI